MSFAHQKARQSQADHRSAGVHLPRVRFVHADSTRSLLDDFRNDIPADYWPASLGTPMWDETITYSSPAR